MDSPQRCKVHFPRNESPAADTSWSSAAFPVPGPQHLQSAHAPYSRQVPGQLHGPMSSPASTVGGHWPDEDWEDMPPPVDNHVVQGQQQDLQYDVMGYYNIANDHPPPHGHRDDAINDYAAFALDVPSHAQAAPPAPIDIFDGPARDTAAGPAQDFVDVWPPQGGVPNGSSNEILRQLAFFYLREPNSQVSLIRLEPGDAHGVRVAITLELANL
ncbi:hypothetical protein DFH94DRAFT_702468 [Russula ochroleuca]|uniref:Uncharacterized protein n=1 Tax=Russula ochroleuca TaxID=152965 RepID=A0A9P5TEA4_9AGAM|nr:hypothetical protein DFH94DRAFT_702468 [Russula ochroleuca]